MPALSAKPGARVLHVGCGGDPLPEWLQGWSEVRLDIDPQHRPDITASMISMGDIGTFDAVVSQHSLEHLYPHEVGRALREFYRVLKPGGIAFVVVPDLEDVRPTEDVLYTMPCGPITGLDLIYGLRSNLAEMPHMAHHTGFVRQTLQAAMTAAGFRTEVRRIPDFNLLAVGVK